MSSLSIFSNKKNTQVRDEAKDLQEGPSRHWQTKVRGPKPLAEEGTLGSSRDEENTGAAGGPG